MVIIDIFRELRCTGHFKYQIVTFQCNFDSRKLEDKVNHSLIQSCDCANFSHNYNSLKI